VTRDRAGESSERQVIDGVLRRYVADGSLDLDEADEVRSVVLLKIAERLLSGVRRIEDYVAAMTHNAARDVFRGRRPERWRLRKRVRAIVHENARFSLDGEWCALREHAGRRAGTVTLAIEDYAAARTLPMTDAVALVLRRAGGAIAFDHLIESFIEVTGMAVGHERMSNHEEPAAGATIDLQLIARETLTALWGEICALLLPQRVALLLHVRDDRGGSAIPLLVFTGTATLDEIAATMEIDRPSMEQLWDELPLADLHIASMLRTTVSRVIGLRRAARERLGRALRRRDEPSREKKFGAASHRHSGCSFMAVHPRERTAPSPYRAARHGRMAPGPAALPPEASATGRPRLTPSLPTTKGDPIHRMSSRRSRRSTTRPLSTTSAWPTSSRLRISLRATR